MSISEGGQSVVLPLRVADARLHTSVNSYAQRFMNEDSPSDHTGWIVYTDPQHTIQFVLGDASYVTVSDCWWPVA